MITTEFFFTNITLKKALFLASNIIEFGTKININTTNTKTW